MRKFLACLLVFSVMPYPVHISANEEIQGLSGERITNQQTQVDDAKLLHFPGEMIEKKGSYISEQSYMNNLGSSYPDSADGWLSYANSQTTSSAMLTAYIEGYNKFPSDNRFVEGINTSARSLLNWASDRHREGKFDTVRVRYEFILTAPNLNSHISDEAAVKLEFARNEKILLLANDLYKIATSTRSLTPRLEYFIDGYRLYSQDARFEEGINQTARELLEWASTRHKEGNLGSAKIRYDLILSSPKLDPLIFEETSTKREFVIEGKVLKSADEYYYLALNESNLSPRLETFIDGHKLYPDDKRFENGINETSRLLLDWATVRHIDGNFGSAILRYDLILSSPILSTIIKSETENKREYAVLEKRLKTADEMYEDANKETNVSPRFEAFVEGYKFYQNDTRFEQGINSSARLLLDWASGKHREGNIGTAIQRYELILSGPTLKDSIRIETENKLGLAQKGEILKTANQLYSDASKQQNSTPKLEGYIEGYKLYPSDNRFEEGINNAAAELLIWAENRHNEEEYGSAILRYNLILSAPKLNASVKSKTLEYIGYAQKGNRTPNYYYIAAINEDNLTPKLEIYIEGVTIYPNDNRLVEGVNSTASSLLSWAEMRHKAENFGSAIIRYELILSSPKLNLSLLNKTQTNLGYARNNNLLPNHFYERAVSTQGVTPRFEKFAEGFALYPGDKKIGEGLIKSSQELLEWAKNEHEKGNFATSIHRYSLIINANGVQTSLKDEVVILLALAQKNLIPGSELIERTEYNVTINDSINIQMGLSTPPQTDKYRNDPGYVHSSLVTITEQGVITGSVVNLRTSPNLENSSIAMEVKNGTVFNIVKEVTGATFDGSNKWFEIKYDNKTLYVHTKLSKKEKLATLNSNSNIRQHADEKSHSFGIEKSNSGLTIIEEVNGTTVSGSNKWYKISYNAWRNATINDVLSYIDPEKNDKFQHLVLSSSVGVNEKQINLILANKGILNGRGQSFIDASKENAVNEIYLIAHALLETGHGTSKLATGVKVGVNSDGSLELVNKENESKLTNIKTTYNMFGIYAYDDDALRQGAFGAYREKWFTPEAAIVGGAKFIGEDFIHNRYQQNTLYKMRWNPESPGNKQYATDIGWAVKQITTIKNLYNQLENPQLHFDIPKYKK
ncbi:N-acetylglucosaminidase [Sutcliffiella horikoshii]|uniref:N-acetylglucosaminidase n=1 Tax=Sutcliffiella horikoshii TaxID=79883 RepID=UPI003CED80E7